MNFQEKVKPGRYLESEIGCSLKQSCDNLKRIMDDLNVLSAIGIPVWVFDVDNSCVVWSNKQGLLHWNADSADELYARDMSLDMSSSVQRRLRQYQTDCLSLNKAFQEEWTTYPQGDPQTSRLSFTHYRLSDGRDALLVQVLAEVSESTATLHSMQALLHTSAMIRLFDQNFELIYTNPAARSTFHIDQTHLQDYLLNYTDFEFVRETLADNRACDVEFPVNTVEGERWHAMNIQVRWQEAGHDISVAINISAKQFLSNDFSHRIQNAIESTGINPVMLNLEVTESMLIQDETHVFNVLEELNKQGIAISIDDFGTGYSNLANLLKYPVSCLKIDRMFLATGHDTLLRVILEMGQLLNMEIVAEGVETIEQVQWLQQNNCDQLQGFFFSRPQPYDVILQYVAGHRPPDFIFASAA